MITRKNILSKTHYGLKIYSYILRQFFPGETVLYVYQNKCKPTMNPFIPGKHRSLQIQMVSREVVNQEYVCKNEYTPTNNPLTPRKQDGLQKEPIHQGMVYQDTEDKNFKGNVFDFAQLYFQADSEDELLIQINDALHLRLESDITDYQSNLLRMNEALDQMPENQWHPKFSYFGNNLYNLYPSAKVSIFETYKMITNTIREFKTIALRKLKSEQQQKVYKKKYFDYVTFSGTFTKRNKSSLIKHSGLLTVDIDGIHSVNKLQEIRETLVRDPHFPTELLFTSPRGKGLKWIIKISLKEVSHTRYFEAVSKYLKQSYKIEVDLSGSDVSRGCLLPYDPNAYIHPKNRP